MQKIRFEEAIRAIRENDQRFDFDAYLFLRDSLDFTLERFRSEESPEHRHVRGPEMLEGLREFALREFGPLAATVLENWGVRSCEDIGDMVFQLIGAGAFGKSEEDRPEDFAGLYDFDEAFREPFRPKRTIQPKTDTHRFRHLDPDTEPESELQPENPSEREGLS